MRVAIAGVVQETDTFSPVPTTVDDFRQLGLYEGEDVLREGQGTSAIGGFLKAVKDEGIDLDPVPIITSSAMAGGTLTADTLAFFEERIVAGLRAAMPIEGFFFDLHGAAAAESDPDVEGHLLEAARRVLGPDVPIVSPFDHHANITQRMIDNLDGLVGYQTQPHDPFATGVLAARMLFSVIRKEISPAIAWVKIPLITHQEQFLTSSGPMKEWFDMARALEQEPGVVSISNFPMQPWLDVPEGGWSTVVVTDGDLPLAKRLATEMATRAWNLREEFWVLTSIPPAEAIRGAVKAPRGVIILSDTGDSVFGGAPGDSTILLREMLEQKITEPALLPMLDPEVVAQAHAAGVGAEITTPIGGKFDSLFSSPIEITARVAGLHEGWIDAEVVGISGFDMGRAALLEVGPVKVVVSEKRGIGGNHPIVYRIFGVEPAEAKMIVLKTASNWQYYADMTSAVVRVDTEGLTMSHLERLPWKRLPRPIYPLDPIEEWRAEGQVHSSL